MIRKEDIVVGQSSPNQLHRYYKKIHIKWLWEVTAMKNNFARAFNRGEERLPLSGHSLFIECFGSFQTGRQMNTEDNNALRQQLHNISSENEIQVIPRHSGFLRDYPPLTALCMQPSFTLMKA